MCPMGCVLLAALFSDEPPGLREDRLLAWHTAGEQRTGFEPRPLGPGSWMLTFACRLSLVRQGWLDVSPQVKISGLSMTHLSSMDLWGPRMPPASGSHLIAAQPLQRAAAFCESSGKGTPRFWSLQVGQTLPGSLHTTSSLSFFTPTYNIGTMTPFCRKENQGSRSLYKVMWFVNGRFWT